MYKPKFEKPKITPAFKKRILKDWQICIPSLTIRNPMAISRRVGPLLISVGFGLKSGRDYYYPGVGVHNLCSPEEFLISTLDTELKGSPIFLSVRAHEDGKYIEAAERIKQQSPLPLEDPISLGVIMNAYKTYVEKKGSSIINELQDPALIAAWAGEKYIAQELLEWGYKEFATWPTRSHEKRGGLDAWYKDMQERIADPERLREIAKEQAIFHKVDSIPEEELII